MGFFANRIVCKGICQVQLENPIPSAMTPLVLVVMEEDTPSRKAGQATA